MGFGICVLPLLYLVGVVVGIPEPARIVVVLAASLLVGVLGHVFVDTAGNAVGGSFARLFGLAASGDRVAFDYSHLQAMVERGRVDEALEEFEALLASHPHDGPLRLRVADVYALRAGDHARAAALFREGRELLLSSRAPRDEKARAGVLYATQRLIDLYDGPLDAEGRALGEMRRLVDTFPQSPEATAARGALERRKRAAGDTGTR